MLIVAQKALSQIFASARFQKELFARFSIEANFQPNVRVEEPKESRFGFCASDICFSLAKHYEIDPQRLAELVAELFACDYFTISVAGGGYLNLDLTDSGILSFLSEEVSFSPSPIEISWESRHLKRAFTREALQLKDSLIQSYDGSLQLLAMLGDPEISPTPFLKGFNGSENVPWYLRRYLNTARALSQIEGVSADIAQFKPFLDNLLRLRGRLQRDFAQGRGERVLKELLHGISLFYSFYNQPVVRGAVVEANETGKIFCRMVDIQRGIIEIALERIEFVSI